MSVEVFTESIYGLGAYGSLAYGDGEYTYEYAMPPFPQARQHISGVTYPDPADPVLGGTPLIIRDYGRTFG